MQQLSNPFTERGAIENPERFAGRWAELSQVFESLEGIRPALLCGSPSIGKSSLLIHIAQSAALHFEELAMRSFYLDMANASEPGIVYGSIVKALGFRGDSLASVEVSLLEEEVPPLVALDNVHKLFEHEWGERVFEALARLHRAHKLYLVGAMNGRPPQLSEPITTISLGAMAATEIRLLASAYLDQELDIDFSPNEYNEVARLTLAHPAYVQRAFYHLFESKRNPNYNWRKAYLTEAKDQPVPGAPLPPSVFEGVSNMRMPDGSYVEIDPDDPSSYPELYPLSQNNTLGWWVLLLFVTLIAWVFSSNIWLCLAIAIIGGAVLAWLHKRQSKTS